MPEPMSARSGPDPWLEVRASLRRAAFTLEVEWSVAAPTVGVVGPSGAGKTTLLRLIAGLEPSTGIVRALGELWQGDTPPARAPWERGVGWVPQAHLLFPHLDVRRNLGFGGAREDAVLEVAELLEIAHLLDRRPGDLSGGESQRVALGRALAAEPRLLLLDEPFSALDRALRRRIGKRILSRARARDLPMILVSHDEHDIAALADEVWEMEGGRLAPFG